MLIQKQGFLIFVIPHDKETFLTVRNVLYIISRDISAIFFEVENGESEFRISDLQLGLATLEKVFLNIARRGEIETATTEGTMVTLN